jgi:WD repeat-containing protein 89
VYVERSRPITPNLRFFDDSKSLVLNVVTAPGSARSLLCFDVSTDGLTVAAGTDLQGDDALIQYW